MNTTVVIGVLILVCSILFILLALWLVMYARKDTMSVMPDNTIESSDITHPDVCPYVHFRQYSLDTKNYAYVISGKSPRECDAWSLYTEKETITSHSHYQDNIYIIVTPYMKVFKYLRRKLCLKVDIITKEFLNPHIKDQVLKEAVPI